MYACYDCGNLDKSRKENSPNGTEHYIYGCNARGMGHACGWISKDSELKTQGCTSWTDIQKSKAQQISLFDFFEEE